MTPQIFSGKIHRRTLLKGAVAAGVLQVTGPFVIRARGETPLRIGMVDPLTGAYAAPAQNEVTGAKLAVGQINAKGGILGRPVELLVEDSANDSGTGVQKAHKLIDRDQVTFLIGDVNSAVALALAQVTSQNKMLHIIPGGHTDPITGTDCHWNVYRVCNSTRTVSNAVVARVYKKYGKRWHFITPDYAFGHTLQQGFAINLKNFGGTATGNELAPLGTTDFSAYLIKARAAKPDVILVLVQGQDIVNCMKQIVQFGINKQIPISGGYTELEDVEGEPLEARFGNWMLEWYWNQPGVPHVKEFVAEIRKVNGGKVPTARHWFGYAAAYTVGLIANQEKSIDSLKLARALGGFELPPEVKLQPNKVYYRAGDHQLIISAFLGEVVAKGKDDPEDLFHVDEVVAGEKTALPVTETGCKLQWPA
jgi:branched-chain amino acid transport system substrate-binding protein